MSIDEAQISHLLAGRVRVRIPARRRDAPFFAEVARRLQDCDGVEAVRASPLTASLLILHSTKLDAIAAWAAQQQLFSLHVPPAESRARPRNLALRVGTRPALLDARMQAIRRARMISTSLAGLGALQTVRGQFLAPALTLFWYAYDARRGLPSAKFDPGSPPKSEPS